MIWVDIFKVGAEVHRAGQVVEITESFANSMLRNHQRLTGEGAEIVVLKEHERDGIVYGRVHGLRVWDGMLQAQMEFYRETDKTAFNAGMLRRFSPGFALNFEHPHTGEPLGPTLLEVSFTAMPFQTNLRPPQVTNPGVRLALNYPGEIITPQDEDDMNEETTAVETAEAVEPVEASPEVSALDVILERIAALEARLEPAKPSAELSDSERIIEQLSQKVAALEDEKVIMELDAAGITENVDAFVALKRTSPELFRFTLAQATNQLRVQAPIGQPGTEAVDAELSADALIEMAANEGATYGNGLTLWLAKSHPERLDEVLAVARD